MFKDRTFIFFILIVCSCKLWAGSDTQEHFGPPRKLSDLHRFLGEQVQKVFGTTFKYKTVVWGRSTEIIPSGRFRKIELNFSGFQYLGLHFEKGEFLIDHLWVNPKRLARWEMEVEKVGEVQSRLVFSLPSLQEKLAQEMGTELKVKADVANQELSLSGKGRLLFLTLPFECRVAFRWDGNSLWLVPKAERWGGVQLPKWLFWVAKACPEKPVFVLPTSWIPYNIQEFHLSWDKVTLSTNW